MSVTMSFDLTAFTDHYGNAVEADMLSLAYEGYMTYVYDCSLSETELDWREHYADWYYQAIIERRLASNIDADGMVSVNDHQLHEIMEYLRDNHYVGVKTAIAAIRTEGPIRKFTVLSITPKVIIAKAILVTGHKERT